MKTEPYKTRLRVSLGYTSEVVESEFDELDKTDLFKELNINYDNDGFLFEE